MMFSAEKKQMTTLLDAPGMPVVNQGIARQTASDYVATMIDPLFTLVESGQYYHKPLMRTVWQFIIRCADGPLHPIYVDLQNGEVIPLSPPDIQMVREKAAILAAEKQHQLPVDQQGYVLAEYARRKANSYLGREVSLFYSVTNGVFIPLVRPIWQFMIQVQLPRLGTLGMMGAIDVDAQTGEVMPLTRKQIKQIRERADALVQFHTQTPAA